jgi:ferritin-like metal-binding protein YciE
MSSATETITDYLRQAQDSEHESLSMLESHLRGAPPGQYRTVVRRHLDETRRHAQQVSERLTDLGASRHPVELAIGLGEAVVGRMLGVALTPLHLLSGRTQPDELLRHAEDDIGAEAREVAIYDALERLAREAGDATTASLARTIRADEERALEALRDLVPALAERVARERIGTERSPSPVAEEPSEPEPERPPAGTTNGGPVVTERETPYRDRAERLREARRRAERSPEGPTRSQAARLREREEDEVVESEGAADPTAEVHVSGEPWPGYGKMRATEIVARLGESDTATRAIVRLYESNNRKRKSILAATDR